MTEQGQNPSQFEPRADDAALALKGQLNQEHGLNLTQKQVAVGPDGRPPAPLPPPGSYVRQAIEQQRAAAQNDMGQPTQQQVLGQQPPMGTTEQAIDGSQAPPPPQGQPPQGPDDQQFSQKANERFSKLSQDLRLAEQERQAAVAEVKELKLSAGQTAEQLTALQQQHQQMLQSNLENLDPETRMQVMQDARMREYFAGFKKEMMDVFQPQIQGLEENRIHGELMQLANKYPRFDVQVHGPSIEMFRGKHPGIPIEQAFKAIAEPEELVVRGAVSQTAVPPTLAPGGRDPANTRYIAAPQSNPEQEMREESIAWKQLIADADPAKQKTGYRLLEKNMSDRLGDHLPR
jgi:hypothetical protein